MRPANITLILYDHIDTDSLCKLHELFQTHIRCTQQLSVCNRTLTTNFTSDIGSEFILQVLSLLKEGIHYSSVSIEEFTISYKYVNNPSDYVGTIQVSELLEIFNHKLDGEEDANNTR